LERATQTVVEVRIERGDGGDVANGADVEPLSGEGC
jgi:hypothetical protein